MLQPEAAVSPRRDDEDPANSGGPSRAPASMPRCPGCGWQDVRPSRLRGAVDSFLGAFGIVPFRCRSCGRRFYRFRLQGRKVRP